MNFADMAARTVPFLLLFLFALAARAQDTTQAPLRDPATGKYTYEQVLAADTAGATTLFQRGAYWFERRYNVQRLNVLDPEHGILSQTGSFPVSFIVMGNTTELQVLYTATVAVRAGRYKCTFTDFLVAQNGSGTTRTLTLEGYCDRHVPVARKLTHRVNAEILHQVDARMTSIIADLVRTMAGGTPAADRW